jgi:hypothetical protein
MTQQQAEANWGWDAKRGSIPFKRPRLTPENIRAQQKLARPGTLIHWAKQPCSRGKAKTDERTEKIAEVRSQLTSQPRLESVALGVGGKAHGTVRFLALASHIDNVNCLKCRRRYFSR